MSTLQRTSNKATIRRFQDATNTHDAKLISRTIDEFVEPDALIRTPLSIKATGAQRLKEVFARLHRVYPDLHVTIEDLIEEGDKVVSRNMVTGIPDQYGRRWDGDDGETPPPADPELTDLPALQPGWGPRHR